ncbi:uncharacterized protein LOC110822459 isoform X3 [Carica papaya]|uniref:uncharacterized protein LOC110822459 isoform X3 n=1 Tax=Carica papaya TaxID=3649 RepID=UPI000B8CF190|nr:uncharacterized protein LOC110822459 isoform X3 [Carica papaya]
MDPRPRKRPKASPNRPSPSSSSFPSSIMEPPASLFPSKGELLRLIPVLAIAYSVAFACHFVLNFINTSPKPFCNSNVDYVDSVSDFCQPCPSNGECYEGKLICAHGYRKLGSLCVEDGDINETAKQLSKQIEVRLCSAYAQVLCTGIGSIWILEDAIWKDLDWSDLKVNTEPDSAIYQHVRNRTVENVSKFLEMRTNSNGTKELKCPDLLVEHYKPLACCIRQWISKHVFIIFPVCTLLVGCTLVLQRVSRRRYLSTRVEELYHQVCDTLEENALTSKSRGGEFEPWVVASRLRDHLLLPRERKDVELWKKVEDLVQEDSRVDRHPKIVKGESKVVWEWQVEGCLSSSRLKKKRESKLKSSEGMDLNSEEKKCTVMACGSPNIAELICRLLVFLQSLTNRC